MLFSNTTSNIKWSSNLNHSFSTNIGFPQGDYLSRYLLIIYPEKALPTLCNRVDNRHVISEHSYAVSFKNTLPEEYICADDTDLINNSGERINKTVADSHPYFCWIQSTDQWYQNRTYDSEKRWKKEELSSTKQPGSLTGNQKEILRRKQLSTTALHNVTWITSTSGKTE